ncbi:MAG: 2-phospho-L-lactate guanylyltransferase [Candidatus Helarchaeota archaeon]
MKYLIIPIKSFKNSKNRLKNDLEDEVRIKLCQFMARDVLNVVSKTEYFDKIIIISKEKDFFFQYLNEKIILVNEEEETGINNAIYLVFKRFNINDKDSILILHSDIPLLTLEDLQLITEKINSFKRIAIIISSLRKDGTNALFLKPANLINIQFGENSYERHLKALLKIKDLEIVSIECKNISLDIDTLQDLILFNKKKSHTLSQEYLNEINFIEKIGKKKEITLPRYY